MKFENYHETTFYMHENNVLPRQIFAAFQDLRASNSQSIIFK